jgi:hypothetical protein
MHRTSDQDLKVVWTRGKGCSELAEALEGGPAERLQGDAAKGCIDQRADVLVSKKLPSGFDLVNVAVPVQFEPENVKRVVATVAGGPHSALVAQTASSLAASLGVPAEMISAASTEEGMSAAEEILEQLGMDFPNLGRQVVLVKEISDLSEGLEEGTLVVMGAPGGSWLSRSRTGPGARLRRTAQAGAVVVRSAPDRVFRFMGDPVYVAPLRHADDTLRIHSESTLAVADEGRLIGLVRREGLLRAGGDPVASVMEDAISVRVDETILQARALEPTFGPDPIPVTDDEEYLVGGLSLPTA